MWLQFQLDPSWLPRAWLAPGPAPAAGSCWWGRVALTEAAAKNRLSLSPLSTDMTPGDEPGRHRHKVPFCYLVTGRADQDIKQKQGMASTGAAPKTHNGSLLSQRIYL